MSDGEAVGYPGLKGKMEGIPMRSLHAAAQISSTTCRFESRTDTGGCLYPFVSYHEWHAAKPPSLGTHSTCRYACALYAAAVSEVCQWS